MPQSPLDTDQIIRQTFVAEVEHHATLNSTNDLAKIRAAEPSRRLPLLILADEQTAGRGRGSNRWWTGPGSLAFSLLVDLGEMGIARSRSPLVALAAAVAVVEAAAPRLPAFTVGLHWPNDIYVDGRKLSGVLVEVVASGRAIVGIGMNTNNSLEQAPPELRKTAVTLLDLTGAAHPQTEILIAILNRLEDLLRKSIDQPANIGQLANALCLQRGRELTIDLGNRSATGICAGIDLDGSLLLRTPAGLGKYCSGVIQRPSAWTH